MSTLSLHQPARRGFARWSLSALAILSVHLAVAAAVIAWYAHVPREPVTIPAISVSLAPVTSAPEPQHEAVAIAPTVQEAAEPTPPEPPKLEQQPIEDVKPPPVQRAEVMLPKPEPKPKPVERKRPPPKPAAEEKRAPPRTERIARYSEAGSTAYNSQVFGHLQRFKRYPDGADGAIGKATVRFVLNRAGQVLSSAIARSSGHAALDREAVAIVRRASPFPPFPADKPGAQDSFIAPIDFAR